MVKKLVFVQVTLASINNFTGTFNGAHPDSIYYEILTLPKSAGLNGSDRSHVQTMANVLKFEDIKGPQRNDALLPDTR